MEDIRNNELIKSLGDRIRILRKKKSLTLEQLAFASELELSQVHRIEKGKNNPSITTLKAIANGLQITLSELFEKI